MNDYFTVEEFRASAGALKGARFDEQQITDAQSQVIAVLERWAHTAWPNVTARGTGTMTLGDPTLAAVTGAFTADDVDKDVRVVGAGAAGVDLQTTVASYTDPTHVELADDAATAVTGAAMYVAADGIAASPRSMTEVFDGGTATLFFRYRPVIDVTSMMLDDDVLDPDDYYLYADAGYIRLGVEPSQYGYRRYTLSYTYGATECPMAVKGPCILATRSLLMQNLPTQVPANVSQLTTEATTMLFGQFGTRDKKPWPWDQEASDQIKSYWRQVGRFAAV